MIKIIVLLNVLMMGQFTSAAQKVDTATGYFDSDESLDTIYYNYVSYADGGPAYQLHLIRTCGEQHWFMISVGFESMHIHDCKKGCIETWQMMAGNMGCEITTRYRYDPRYDDWLEVEEIVVAPREKAEMSHPDVPTGISGKEYPKEKRRKKPKRQRCAIR